MKPRIKYPERQNSKAATGGVVLNFVKFTGNNTCAIVSFLNKFAGLRPATLLKRRLWQRCFPVNFAKFSRTHSHDCFWKLFTEITCWNSQYQKVLADKKSQPVIHGCSKEKLLWKILESFLVTFKAGYGARPNDCFVNGTKCSGMDQVKFAEDSHFSWSILEYFDPNAEYY